MLLSWVICLSKLNCLNTVFTFKSQYKMQQSEIIFLFRFFPFFPFFILKLKDDVLTCFIQF